MGSVQQQIYASLAIEGLKAGHHTHAATPDLDAATIERHEEICNHWGQYEASSPFRRSLVHLPLFEDGGSAPSHHLVVLISDQGRDAKGRPGAMLRHLVRLDAATYRSYDCQPFHLWRQGLLLDRWDPETPFPVIEARTDPTSGSDLQTIFPERYPMLRGLLSHLLAGGRLHLHAAQDSPAAEETLDQLLELLPPSRRAALALTTFAYANGNDYQLAVVRRPGTDLRESLDGCLDTPAEGLAEEDRGYLDRLFTALQARAWDRASAIVHGADPPAPVRSADPAPGTGGGAGAAHPASRPAAGGSAEEDMSEWAPTFRRGGEKRASGSGRRWLWLLALVVVIGGGAVAALLQGRGGGGPVGGRVNTRVEAAADLDGLVREHVGRLETLVEQGARDFDLSEAMTGMHARLEELVAATLLREKESVAADLAGTGGDPESIVGVLREAAGRMEAVGGRLARLEEILSDRDVEAARAAVATENGAVGWGRSDPVSGRTPIAATVDAWAASLASCVGPVREIEELDWPPTPEVWRTSAQALGGPAEVVDPLAALAEALERQAGLLESMRADAARTTGPAHPFEQVEPLRVRDAGRRARASLGGLPAPMASMETLVALAVGAVEGFDGGRADGWLESLGEATASGAPLAPVVADGGSPVRPWLVRWRLEALRADGGRVEEPTGFVAAGLEEAREVAQALDEYARAPVPAPAALVQGARGRLSGLEEPVHRDLVGAWIDRQERGRERTGSAFADVYSALGSASEEFGRSPSPETWKRLRESLARVESVGLEAVARDPGRRSEVAAVRSLSRALGTAVEVAPLTVRVELLGRRDYSGSDRSLAQLRAVLSRRSDGAVLWQAGAAPMIAPPGAAFRAIVVEGGSSFEVAADEPLQLVIRDEKSGMLWAHVWIDAPAGGHVLTALDGTHEVRVSAEQRQRLQDGSDGERPDGRGDPVARVEVDVDEGYWTALAAAVPVLP